MVELNLLHYFPLEISIQESYSIIKYIPESPFQNQANFFTRVLDSLKKNLSCKEEVCISSIDLYCKLITVCYSAF